MTCEFQIADFTLYKQADPINLQASPIKVNNNSKIRVVIRIRPISKKETEKGYRNILEPVGNGDQIRIWDPVSIDIVNKIDLKSNLDTSFWYRLYTFDRCLWSMNESNGLNATQEDVFMDVGKPVLDWILGGYNCRYDTLSIILL